MIRSIADLQQMKEAYLEKMGQYSHLCMVCYGTGCMSSGCKNVRDAMVEELEKAGLTDKVAVIERGCMGTCAVGPVVYVLPDETYYTEMTPERVKDVVQKHFIGGVPFGMSASSPALKNAPAVRRSRYPRTTSIILMPPS